MKTKNTFLSYGTTVYGTTVYGKSNRREEGSLFLMVLMVLLILTGVGLSLVFVTEVEMQMGGTEKVLNQTFYAAETGVHVALGGLVNQNWEGEEIAFIEGDLSPTRRIGTRIKTTNINMVGTPQLPPMSLANEGSREYNTYAVALTAIAERVTWPTPADGSEDAPIYPYGDSRENLVSLQSQRRVDVRYLVSPVSRPAFSRQGMKRDEEAVRGSINP